MSRRGDACSPMDIRPYVPLVCDQRRAGMEPHAHPDRPSREAPSDRARGFERARCRGEGDEEGIALRVHFDAVVRRARLSDQSAVFCKRLRVGLSAQLVQKARRALDIGEEEGDRPCGKRDAHGKSIARGRACSKCDGKVLRVEPTSPPAVSAGE